MSKESSAYKGTVIVVPTRNRAAIAMNAIRSALDQPVNTIQVLVSDNSTWEQDQVDLQSFCADLSDPRVRYVQPPQPLAMTAHWEWAIQQATSLYETSHFLYLTDRMMFKPGALTELVDRAVVYPDKIISYNHDRIVDDKVPIRIEQHPHTSQLFEIKTGELSRLYARSMFSHSFPRMLNCVAPRTVLNRIKQRFGNVFSSIAPDFNFCCRCLEMEDSILYYDKSLIFHYALKVSHGASVTRGEATASNLDFAANLGTISVARNFATPIPELNTCTNAIHNEYLILKQESESSRFFDIDIENYWRMNATEIEEVIDPQQKARMFELLRTNGWQGPVNGHQEQKASVDVLQKLLSPGKVWNKLQRALRSSARESWTKPTWLFLARAFGVKPPAENSFRFSDSEQAIDYLCRFERPRSVDQPAEMTAMGARVLPFTGQEQTAE